MTRPRTTNYNFVVLNIAAYVTLVMFALPVLLKWGDLEYPWMFVLLVVVFAVALALYQRYEYDERVIHVYLGIQTAVICSLFLILPNGHDTGILFFILSAQSMLLLPTRRAVLWLILFSLVVVSAFLVRFGWEDIFDALLMSGGFTFFGTFGWSLRHAEAARHRSQELLEELQTAHSQLKEYAAQAEQLAVAEERNRLAREMHDSLGHRLTVAVVQLEGAQRLIPTHPERAGRMVGTMREQLKEALTELRQTVATLRTSLVDDLPLGTAVSRLAQSFQESTGLKIYLTLPSQLPALPASHRLALYRAAQESLTNVQRHAGASQVWLDVTQANGGIRLAVHDDGKGFSGEVPDGRFGLHGLRERAVQLGGELQVENHPDGGTLVTFYLPYV